MYFAGLLVIGEKESSATTSGKPGKLTNKKGEKGSKENTPEGENADLPQVCTYM